MPDPSISVIIVNLNGRHLLDECLTALLNQSYPQERIEIIVVDNGSTDDSVAHLRSAFPQIKVIEAGANRGFAGGNNLGAAHATGDCLALINNDAVADSHWLRNMVDAMQSAPDVACVGARLLNGDGTCIDFAGTAMNIYGRAFQVDEGLPAIDDSHVREMLAACGGAMLIQREVFEKCGSFDADYIAYYEDVDLGWRLWLMGYRVLYVPAATVRHKQHQTGSRFPAEQRFALSEANALRTIIKNYDEPNLNKVLPFSLIMATQRAMAHAGIDANAYRFGQPWQPRDTSLNGLPASYLAAIQHIALDWPQLMEKRRQVQALRVRSDDDLFARFPTRADNPIFPWRHYTTMQEDLARSMGLPDALQPGRGKRLLIVTHERIGPKMAGPGIRAWELACALAETCGVILAAPAPIQREHPGVRLAEYDPASPQEGLAPWLNACDVVMAMGTLFTSMPALQQINKPTIIDLYDPYELETLAQTLTMTDAQQKRNVDRDNLIRLDQIAQRGDFYLCASERQRDLWLGLLLAKGRVNAANYAHDPTLQTLIDLVPFGMPAQPPAQTQPVLKGVRKGIDTGDKVLLWNGGLWPWFDPDTVIDALQIALKQDARIKLFFAAGQHFDATIVQAMPLQAHIAERCKAAGLLDTHVFFGDWIAYDERGSYLLEADVAISAHKPSLESHFASRTRLLDCVWAGLPVVATEGDPLSALIAQHGIGLAVKASDPQAMSNAILEIIHDDQWRTRMAPACESLRQVHSWPLVAAPIARFMQHAQFAPDAGLLGSPSNVTAGQATSEMRYLQKQVDDLQTQVTQLQSLVDGLQRGRVMRMVRALDVLRGRA